MKANKFISLLLVFLMVLGAAVVVNAQDDEPLRVTLVINGVLGDKSFFDSAQRGMDRAMDDFNVEVETVELGIDPANWESGFDDVLANEGTYDMIVVGTFQMAEFVATRAHMYPDIPIILYDVDVPYDDPEVCVEGCTNVYSVLYSQNEGSFLAGIYAAAMSMSEDVEGANEAAIIGAIGGQEIPVINDFIVGYEQGACLINPETELIVQYAGGWNDPARGKEIALAMYEQDADIVFQIAGGTGVGVFEAAAEQGRYAIGVDSDQATIILDTDPDQAERILTSMMKNVDNSLYRAMELYFNDELPLGEAEVLGIAEGGVGLAVNEIYDEFTPDSIKEIVAAAEEAVINGDIEVNTVFAPEGEAATVGMGCENMPEVDIDLMGDM